MNPEPQEPKTEPEAMTSTPPVEEKQAPVATSSDEAPPQSAATVTSAYATSASAPRGSGAGKRFRLRRPLSPGKFLLLLNVLVVPLVAIFIYDGVASVRLPPSLMKGLLPFTLLFGTCLCFLQWVAGIRGILWLAQHSRNGMPNKTTEEQLWPTWRRVLAALGMLSFTVVYGLLALGIGMFILLSTSADWQRVEGVDGTVYWQQSLLAAGKVYHRELAHGFVSAAGEGQCDQPDCVPPLNSTELQSQQTSGTTLPEPSTDIFAPYTTVPQQTIQPGAGDTIPAVNITVTDDSGKFGLTGRGIEMAVHTSDGWVGRGVIKSTGEPIMLRWANGSCAAGIGAANGGEVWLSRDEGATWTQATLPDSIPAEQRFLTDATPEANPPGAWRVCVTYPTWVQNNTDPTCLILQAS